jgi:glycosyltransferase involved in cell wall biosynthesis
MSACRAFVMTSKREGMPTALLEAMYMGKPVVVPAHSGCKEVVVSDEYGFLYEPNSLDDLVKQTRRALGSTHIGEKAKTRVSQQYDWKILAKSIDLAYERTINA